MQKIYNQLTLSDVYKNCQDLFETEKPKFLKLLESIIDFADFIPQSFYDAFYQHFGRNRSYSLESFISAFVLQKIFSIPTDTLLITFLNVSEELKNFCGFKKVPDNSKFTRFKQRFIGELTLMFDSLVDYTEPICTAIDKNLASSLIYDTSGLEPYVTENNPKFVNKLINSLKSVYKNDPSVDIYKLAYNFMPSHSASEPSVKQMYINGHFCYAHKFGILTNGLGIPRHLAFFDDEYTKLHPEISVEKKSDSPDEDKSLGDSRTLQPVLGDFFSKHPDFHYDTFLGDSAFDSADHFSFLKNTCNFKKALIPINPRNESLLPSVGYNEFGYPVCPGDPKLDMRYLGATREKGRSNRLKWGCPKFKKGVCHCSKPCSDAKFGRTSYTFESGNFRLFPGIPRDSVEWFSAYKTRTVIEQSINHIKYNMCVADRKSRCFATSKSDILFACISQLFTVIVADRLKNLKLFRSLKCLIA